MAERYGRLHKMITRLGFAGLSASEEQLTLIPRLETPRLVLRQLYESDADDMYDYSCREEVTRFLLWDTHPSVGYTRRYLHDLQEKYRACEYYDWGLELSENGRLIGTCGFAKLDTENRCGEIGYVIHPDYHGQGLAAEAAACVIAFGFLKLRLHRVEARYMVGNEASRRVMEKCGMTFEGIHREAIYVKDAYHDVGVCALLREDYFDPHANRTDTPNADAHAVQT